MCRCSVILSPWPWLSYPCKDADRPRVSLILKATSIDDQIRILVPIRARKLLHTCSWLSCRSRTQIDLFCIIYCFKSCEKKLSSRSFDDYITTSLAEDTIFPFLWKKAFRRKSWKSREGFKGRKILWNFFFIFLWFGQFPATYEKFSKNIFCDQLQLVTSCDQLWPAVTNCD